MMLFLITRVVLSLFYHVRSILYFYGFPLLYYILIDNILLTFCFGPIIFDVYYDFSKIVFYFIENY